LLLLFFGPVFGPESIYRMKLLFAESIYRMNLLFAECIHQNSFKIFSFSLLDIDIDHLFGFFGPTERKVPAVWLERKPTNQSNKNESVSNYTILYSAGSVEDLGYTHEWLSSMRDTLHCSVISYEYTGYGHHNGKPSEKNCYDDLISVFKYLINVKKLSSESIILYGRCKNTQTHTDTHNGTLTHNGE
jgi:hypothetical protein